MSIVLRKMVSISNNSRLTQEAADIIDKLPQDQKSKLEQWLIHADREVETKIQQERRKLR